MALIYDGANGLFTRLGKLVKMMQAVQDHQTNLKTLLAEVQGTYSSADAWMIDRLSGTIETRIAEAGYILDDIQLGANMTLIEMCFAEAAASTTNSMRSKNIYDGIVWLIRQMDADSERINGTTITKSAVTLGSGNNGNGTFVYLFDAPNVLLGTTADFPNIRTEMLEVRCVVDAQDGRMIEGAEAFEVRGQPSYPSMDYRFPAGSGVRLGVNSVTAAIDNGSTYSNILTNSDLENWTSNIPDQFTVSSGTAGTDFLAESADPYRGTYGLKAEATGAVFKIRQRLGSVTGSVSKLASDRPYVIAAAMRKDASATGTIRLSIQDSAGSVIDSGAVAKTVTEGNMLTTYTLQSLTFRTPRIIPTEIYLVLESTVAVTTAAMYVDEVVLAEMTPIARGGQAIAIIAGETNWNLDDNARYNFTNNAEGVFVEAFDKFFQMYEQGLSIPPNYVGSETILDSLAT